MHLIKLKITDFRRFAGEQSLDLNEDLIALVGPNEAGKSSILNAIDLVGRRMQPHRKQTQLVVSPVRPQSQLYSPSIQTTEQPLPSSTPAPPRPGYGNARS